MFHSMKIAVNTRLLLKGKLEGIGWFTYETLRRITAAHPEHSFYFIFDRPFSEDFVFSDNVTPLRSFPPARHPYLWYAYFEYSIPVLLNRLKADLFISTDGWLSLRTDIKEYDVIHDINFEHHPDFIRPGMLAYYRKFFPQFARKAARIATVSEFSKQDIHDTYRVETDKIDVVYNGCNQHYKALNEKEQSEIRKHYSRSSEYFLFVSAIHKRKNLANILKAFDDFKEKESNSVKFVVVGNRPAAGAQGDFDAVLASMKHLDDVIFLGHLGAEELAKLAGSALALVYASLFEGFGIPILEAFYAETAVITSNVTSMPEVAGNAALLVDPYAVDSIENAMLSIYKDRSLRNQLVERGRQQREKFSWDRTADLLWRSIEQLF